MMLRISRFCLLFVLAFAATTAHAQSQTTALFRSLGLLGPKASLTKVTVVAPQASQTQNRLMTGSQNLTGPLKFDFSGYPNAPRAVLQKFVQDNYARMVSVYGAPAPEQAGKTVKVVFETAASAYTPPKIGSSNGGTVTFGYSTTSADAVNTFNFTRLALIAFQGPRLPAYDFNSGSYVEPWLYGMADAAALQVAYLAGGSRADFNPSAISTYALTLYDYLNRPELGNAFIYPRPTKDDPDGRNELAISFFRAAMAQSTFLKIAVENPQFYAQFNAQLYARGAAGASISPAELKSIAAGIVPTVEGRSFSDWVRSQYALDASVTTGQKLYMVAYPIAVGANIGNLPTTAPTASVFVQAFATNPDGSEIASTGYGSLRAFDQNGNDISAQSSDLAGNNVLSFNNADQPGQASAVIGFRNTNASNRMLVTLKSYYGQAEATNYSPYGAAGTSTSVSSYFGGTLGGQNGLLQLSGSATQNVNVTNGTWAATVPYPSGPRVQTDFTFGGATVRRNTAWLAPGSQLRSAAFLLEVPSNLQTLAFSTPAGQSAVRMVSLPGFPVETDEAQALNIAPGALKLARYRPNLSPAVSTDGALQFGIGGDRYELYPNISAPIAPGRGYWLGVGQNGYATQVQASLPPANRPYEVPLLGGWNQVGVPFNQNFSTSSIQVRNGGFAPVSLSVAQARGWVAPGIWRWLPAGGYVRADTGAATLVPFEGYFIFAGPQRGVSLVFDASVNGLAKASSARASSARTAPGSWSVSLHASGQTTQDIAGVFGVSSEPNIAKPPAGARVVSLRFEGSDAQNASASGSGLAESYVAALGTGASWTAVVDGTENGENVTLKWGDFARALSGVSLTLQDGTTGARVAMKSGGSYRFVAGKTPRRLLISAAPVQLDPRVAPSLAPAAARTTDSLRVAPNASGFAADAKLTYRYVWRNGSHVLRETGATLDLSKPGRGDRGDTVSVEVTARDEQGHSATGIARIKVGNSDPFVADGVLRAQLGATSSVKLTSSDADGDALRLMIWNRPGRGSAEVRKVRGVWTLFYTATKVGSDVVQIVAVDSFRGHSKAAAIRVTVTPSGASAVATPGASASAS